MPRDGFLAGGLADVGSQLAGGLLQGRLAAEDLQARREERQRRIQESQWLQGLREADLRFRQQQEERLRGQATRPQIFGNRVLQQGPGGQWQIQELPTPAETPQQKAQREEREATTAYRRRQTEELGKPKAPVPRAAAPIPAEHQMLFESWREKHPGGSYVDFYTSVIKPPKAPGFGDELLSPGAAMDAAKRYNATGTLPPLGMGKSKGRKQVLDLAAEIRKGEYNADEPWVRQAALQADKRALSSNEVKAANFGAFATSFDLGLNRGLELSDKLALRGIQTWNRFQLQAMAETGDEDANNLLRQMGVLAREADRVLARATGAGSNESRAEAAKMTDPGFTNQQFHSLITNVLRPDRLYAVMGFDEERERILTRMRTAGKKAEGPSPIAPPAAVAAPPAATPQATRKFNARTGRFE